MGSRVSRKLSYSQRGGLTTAVKAALSKATLGHDQSKPPPSMPRLKCLEKPVPTVPPRRP